MANMTVLLMVAAAVVTVSVVDSLPVDTASVAVTALHSLKSRGETIVTVDELPEELRQALEGHRARLAGRKAEDDAPAGKGEAWSAAGGADDDAMLSPAILAFMTSSGISKKDVASVSRHLQHLEETW